MTTTSGYSGTPLVKKLGIKERDHVWFVHTPAHYFELLEGLPEVVTVGDPRAQSVDFIHFFCTHFEELESGFNDLKKALKYSGMLWVSWPKGRSKIPTDLNGNIVRRFGLMQGLVDVKVCAVDADWSGLKFMYRLKDRPAK